ncbi:MAG TPA: DUF72 domain-containing protein [Flavisolibacter sp.]|nr:DUF72 domain-containing protein [Flavisolibacter sp.]
MATQIHVGTSGWSYQHWKEVFYPHKLAAAKWLPYYAGIFPTTEINGSFYRLPSEDTVKKWAELVPDDFVFCPKMSRYLTHMKKLKDPEEPLERFFSVFNYMEKKMGPVLIQLPEMLRFNYDVAEHFYRLLKFQYKAYEFVIEVRHETWLQEDSLTLMTRYDIGFVISQSGGFFPYSEKITAKNIYVRFHGPADLYASAYSNEMLQQFAKKFKRWVKEGHKVWAYFNNDIHAHAVRDAQRLMQMLGK